MSFSEWKEVKLGDVCDVNKSSYSVSDNWEFINYLDTGNITENKIASIQYLNTNVDKIPSRAKRKVNANDIIYSTVRPNQKHYGIIKCPLENMLVSTGFTVITGMMGKAESEYLYYYLSQQNIIEMLHAIGEHSTSAYPAIKASDIEDIKLLMPPLPEQKNIAATLSCLDEKIELNNLINKTLEEMAQAIFKSWFVDFEPFQDGEFEDSELGMIPKGWRVDSIDHCTSLVTRGITPKYADISDQYVINQKCIRNGSLSTTLSRTHYSVVNKEKMLQFGDILINSTGVGTLGRVAQVYEDLENYTADAHVTIVRPNTTNKMSYMGCLLKNMQPKFEHAGTGSTGQTELGRDAIKQMQILVPNDSVLEEFSKIYDSIYRKIVCGQKETILVSNMRDKILPKLMSGEIRVPIQEVQ